MNDQSISMLFLLLRSAISGKKLNESEKALLSSEQLPEIIRLSRKHDIGHLLALAFKQNGMAIPAGSGIEQSVLRAIYRYERLNGEYQALCQTLEDANIPFIPLKGSVLRDYYPEAWMRTSCDVDILIHHEHLDKAVALLTGACGYTYHGKSTYDVSLLTPGKVHIELHYDLIEDGRVNDSSKVLHSVWEHASVRAGYCCWYELSDAMFYYYHIVHMAKHFENGGCGIRPFIDLLILDNLENKNQAERATLLAEGKLLKFSEAATKLSKIWFEGAEKDAISQHMEDFILRGGVYGTVSTSAIVKATQGESRIKYLLKMAFLSRKNLAKLYPKLNQYPILFPFYQVKRWFLVFDKNKRQKIQHLADVRSAVSKENINSTEELFEYLGVTE